MMVKSKPLEIASGIVGVLFAAAFAVIVFLQIVKITSIDWNTEGAENAGILVFLISLPMKIMLDIIAIAISLLAVYYIVSAVLPIFLRKISALRVFAIITSILLALEIITQSDNIFKYIFDGFRNGNYLYAMLSIAFAVLTLAYFLLNVTKAVIYKKQK